MRKIIYYVASSIDGYISGPEDDISGFVQQGSGVEQYLQDLQQFDTVIMGRNTYEFGYKWGIQPGQPAYPHMKHYIFSDTLTFEHPHEQVNVCKMDLNIIQELKAASGTDIYLAGGGMFAGWLLDHQLIDVLKIKLNPLVLGGGIRLFGSSNQSARWLMVESKKFEDGLHIITYLPKYTEILSN
jgi:dihydrofolate reductase